MCGPSSNLLPRIRRATPATIPRITSPLIAWPRASPTILLPSVRLASCPLSSPFHSMTLYENLSSPHTLFAATS